MPEKQRAIVNTYFEESHCELAVLSVFANAVPLNRKIQSNRVFKLWTGCALLGISPQCMRCLHWLSNLSNEVTKRAHIRELIYISLYPPEELAEIPVTNSPRKLQQHRQRRARMPSIEASRQAVNLLSAFSRTNGPNALFQAIPHY